MNTRCQWDIFHVSIFRCEPPNKQYRVCHKAVSCFLDPGLLQYNRWDCPTRRHNNLIRCYHNVAFRTFAGNAHGSSPLWKHHFNFGLKKKCRTDFYGVINKLPSRPFGAGGATQRASTAIGHAFVRPYQFIPDLPVHPQWARTFHQQTCAWSNKWLGKWLNRNFLIELI